MCIKRMLWGIFKFPPPFPHLPLVYQFIFFFYSDTINLSNLQAYLFRLSFIILLIGLFTWLLVYLIYQCLSLSSCISFFHYLCIRASFVIISLICISLSLILSRVSHLLMFLCLTFSPLVYQFFIFLLFTVVLESL